MIQQDRIELLTKLRIFSLESMFKQITKGIDDFHNHKGYKLSGELYLQILLIPKQLSKNFTQLTQSDMQEVTKRREKAIAEKILKLFNCQALTFSQDSEKTLSPKELAKCFVAIKPDEIGTFTRNFFMFQKVLAKVANYWSDAAKNFNEWTLNEAEKFFDSKSTYDEMELKIVKAYPSEEDTYIKFMQTLKVNSSDKKALSEKESSRKEVLTIDTYDKLMQGLKVNSASDKKALSEKESSRNSEDNNVGELQPLLGPASFS